MSEHNGLPETIAAKGAPWVFLPKRIGLLIDNVKYFFLHASRARGNCWFVTPSEEMAAIVQRAGFNAVALQRPEALALVREAEYLFVDTFEFKDYLPPEMLREKAVIQLWHGSPLKKVGMPEAYSATVTDEARRHWLIDRYSGYRAVVSPSPLYNRIFTQAFQTQSIWMTGYPRTDVLLRDLQDGDQLFVDSAFDALSKMDSRIRLGVFMPTFRDRSGSVLLRQDLDWVAFDEFLRGQNTLLLVKLHPYDKMGMALFHRKSFTNIMPLDPDSDVYPILRLAHFLISDYSSIVFDYLLLNRPVIFFMPDFAEYVRQDREFFFEPTLMSPGDVCMNLGDLAEAVVNANDTHGAAFASDRELVIRLSNSYRDGKACERIMDVLLAES